MPFSRNIFDAEFLTFLQGLHPAPRSFLDIGPGAGKYAAIIRKQYSPKARIDAVEVNKSYIKLYKLKTLYSRVIWLDAATLPDQPGQWNYDMVILGDVIEHLRKSDGVDLVEYFLYRAKWIWVVVPPAYLQIDHEQASENHRSVWGIEDFPAQFIHDHQTKAGKHLVILKGMSQAKGTIVPKK